MNIPDNFSGSLETVFRAKIVKFFDEDTDEGPELFWPGIRDRKIRIWDKHPGSATLVRCLLILMIFQVPTVPLVKSSHWYSSWRTNPIKSAESLTAL
jgi:hypothetical protein